MRLRRQLTVYQTVSTPSPHRPRESTVRLRRQLMVDQTVSAPSTHRPRESFVSQLSEEFSLCIHHADANQSIEQSTCPQPRYRERARDKKAVETIGRRSIALRLSLIRSSYGRSDQQAPATTSSRSCGRITRQEDDGQMFDSVLRRKVLISREGRGEDDDDDEQRK